jgi:hypothetical protein
LDKQIQDLLFSQGYQKFEVPLTDGSYETFDYTVANDLGTEDIDPDLMRIKFILCHEGVNGNGDYFTKDVLQKAQLTPRNKPVDWEHGQPIIGAMLDSTYKEDLNGRGFIEATGVVWKFLYPELSASIKSKASTGDLKLSMECYYKEANYKVGEALHTQAEADKLGIIPYVGREYMGQKVTRVFNEVIFGGVGVVANPADKDAVFLSVARDLSSHGIVTEDGSVEISAVSEAIANAITRTINDFKEKIHSEKDVEAVTIAKYVKAFDKAKSLIVAKFNKDKVKTKEQVMSEVRSALNSFLQEVSVISQDYYVGVAVEKSSASDLFFSDIQESIQLQISKYFAELSDGAIDAYLKDVAEAYFIYEIIDYTKQYPDDKMYKGSYSVVDGEVVIDLSSFIEVEEVYVEKSSANENSVKEVITEMQDKTIATEEEVITPVVAEEVEAGKKDDPEDKNDNGVDEDQENPDGSPKKKKASDDAKIAELETKLSEANEAKASLESRLATLEAKLNEIHTEKVLATRLSELKEAGIEFSETRLDKETARIKTMSDADFADHKELLIEVAGKKVEAPVVETAEASLEDDIDDEPVVTIEGILSTAGMHVESVLPKVVSPFGHLMGSK